MARFPWDPEFVWNCRRRCLAILDAVQLLDQFLAVLAHLVQQRSRQEARRLANAKPDWCPATLFQQLEQPLIFFRGVVRVELLSKGGNHRPLQLVIETWSLPQNDQQTGENLGNFIQHCRAWPEKTLFTQILIQARQQCPQNTYEK